MRLDLLGKIAPLFSKKVSQLSDEDIVTIADAVGFKGVLHPELRQAAVLLLQDKEIDTVADVVKSPDAVKQLVTLFSKEVPSEDETCEVEHVLQCPHCRQFFVREL